MLARTCFAIAALSLAACALDKDDGKGAVDESLPPAPTTEDGKADGSDNELPLALESPHPYTNDLDRTWTIDLAAALPSCAERARLHFAVLRTEAGYDYVEVAGESFDGDRDDTWTQWFDVGDGTVDVRLTTDYSITRHGFAIDRVEWSGEGPRCPPLVPCAEGQIGIHAPAAACECPEQDTCVAIDAIHVRHSVSRGRMLGGRETDGLVAATLGLGQWDQVVATPIGTVDAAALDALIAHAAADGLLEGDGYEITPTGDQMFDIYAITTGDRTVTFAAPQGGHTAEVAASIERFEALFACGGDGVLTCGDGHACVDGACEPENTCVCPAVYEPVCGVDGRSYGNGCEAGCAEMGVAHDGECGIVGDPCGGLAGAACLDDNRCRYDVSTFEAPYPDALGACVARTYCDAPVDCLGLPAPAVPGAWACETQACVYRAGLQWRPLTGGRFETSHPYANSTSVWKELTLPAEAQALRLAVVGTFALERNYDFLEVWTWRNGAWVRDRRYTGTAGPALADTFTGRYHYLRFVSDSTITDRGFDVRAEWR